MKNTMYYVTLFLISFGFSILIQKRDLSTYLKEKIYPDSRNVLSTLEAQFSEGGPKFKIIKVKSSGKLLIEIFKQNESLWSPFADFAFDERYDGYFNHDSKASNLFLKDLDGDSISELILPSYDGNFNARINVIKYRVATEDFEKLVR